MTSAQRKQAADGLRRLQERIDRGELDAPRWFRQRLAGAIVALDAVA